MRDIFEEINLLRNEIEEKTETLNNLIKYTSEILDASYVHEVDYQNFDLCLEYISYKEYSSLISQNLRRAFQQLQQEIHEYKNSIEILKVSLKSYLKKVENLSVCSYEDIKTLWMSFNQPFNLGKNFKEVPIFLAMEEKVIINPIFSKIPTLEMISFLKDYINWLYQMELQETEIQR